MGFWKHVTLDRLRAPELICFDHLYSEYLSMKLHISDVDAVAFIDELSAKIGKNERRVPNEASEKTTGRLSWNDLYYFELILVDYLPIEKLRSKIMRLRSDFRCISSEQEYTEYLASKPPDLQSPPEPTDPPDTTPGHYEKLLREDLKDLLSRIYMKYAILPIRETRLTDLTMFAARLCLISLIILLSILLVGFVILLISELKHRPDNMLAVDAFLKSPKLSSLTILVVVVSGAMGGFVSALHRIQSPPTKGDTIYNLSLLFHGSKSVFVAPITGAIFAMVLYFMFTAGILKGSFFPTLYTPDPNSTVDTSSNPAAVSTPAPSPSSTPTATPVPKVEPNYVPTRGLNLLEFLIRTGPGRGEDYALLILWCFIAGFAERFVPDTLDRLISKGKSGDQK